MIDSILQIIDLNAPEASNYELCFPNEPGEVIAIEGTEIDIGNGELLAIYCKVAAKNLGYSFVLKSNGEHRFTLMGFMQSPDSPDPTIMYTANDARDFQILINMK